MHQRHTGAQSERQAAYEHNGMHRPAVCAYIVTVDQIAERVDERNTRHKIKHTCGHCNLRRKTQTCYAARTCRHRRDKLACKHREPHVNMSRKECPFEHIPYKCGDKHDSHCPHVAAEKAAERGVSERDKKCQGPRADTRAVADSGQDCSRLKETNLAVCHLP